MTLTTMPGYVDLVKNERDLVKKLDYLIIFWRHPELSQTKADLLATAIKLTQIAILEKDWQDAVPPSTKFALTSALRNVSTRSPLCPTVQVPFERLLDMIEKPWKMPDITDIMSNKDPETSHNFFLMENIDVCHHRAAILVKHRFFEIAHNFSSYVIKQCPDFKEKNLAEGHLQVLALHIKLSLLLKNTAHLMTLVSQLSVDSYLQLLELVCKRCEEDAFPTDLTKTACSLVLLSGVKMVAKDDLLDLGQLVPYVMALEEGDVIEHFLDVMLKSCSNPVALCSFGKNLRLKNMGGDKYAIYCIRIFLRGISLDLNLLEVANSKKDSRTIDVIERRLADTYMILADLVGPEASPPLHRECVLTAFSLAPSPGLLQRVMDCASSLVENVKRKHEELEEQRKKEEEGGPGGAVLGDLKEAMKGSDTARFETLCDDFCQNLEQHWVAQQRNPNQQHRSYYEGALLSIQGSVLTSRPTYNAFASPLEPFRTEGSLNVPEDLLKDLLVAINVPRWHLLSWSLNWPVLEERCLNLLKDPRLRRPNDQLKHLVIDYTQFEEWSSDEELDASAGIERGYEDWEAVYSTEEEEKVTIKKEPDTDAKVKQEPENKVEVDQEKTSVKLLDQQQNQGEVQKSKEQ